MLCFSKWTNLCNYLRNINNFTGKFKQISENISLIRTCFWFLKISTINKIRKKENAVEAIDWKYELFHTDSWLKMLTSTLNYLESEMPNIQTSFFYISFMRTGIVNQTSLFWITLTEKELWVEKTVTKEWDLLGLEEKIYKKHGYSIEKIARKGESKNETEQKWKVEAEALYAGLIEVLKTDKAQTYLNLRRPFSEVEQQKIFIGEYLSEGLCIFSKGE